MSKKDITRRFYGKRNLFFESKSLNGFLFLHFPMIFCFSLIYFFFFYFGTYRRNIEKKYKSTLQRRGRKKTKIYFEGKKRKGKKNERICYVSFLVPKKKKKNSLVFIYLFLFLYILLLFQIQYKINELILTSHT